MNVFWGFNGDLLGFDGDLKGAPIGSESISITIHVIHVCLPKGFITTINHDVFDIFCIRTL